MEVDKKLIKLINIPITEHTIEIFSHKIHYIVAGKGKPLLLIHGANIGWGQWYPNIAALAKHFTVYALDLPGAGGSSKIDFHTADLEKSFVQLTEEFIKSNKLKDVSIIAHSIGGWVALKLALKKNQTIKKIVLVNPLGISTTMPHRYRPIAFYPLALLISKTVLKPNQANIRKFLQSVVSQSTEIKEEFINYFTANIVRDTVTHPLLLINRFAGFIRIKDAFMIKNLQDITIPILLIIGEKDALTPWKQIKQLTKNISTIEHHVMATGHVPSLEKSQEFNREVLNFLQR